MSCALPTSLPPCILLLLLLLQISLADLTILCTLRAAMTTLQHLHDSYLLSTLLAVLLDLSPFLQQLSPYCSERVVVLAVRLSRKYSRGEEEEQGEEQGEGGESPVARRTWASA